MKKFVLILLLVTSKSFAIASQVDCQATAYTLDKSAPYHIGHIEKVLKGFPMVHTSKLGAGVTEALPEFDLGDYVMKARIIAFDSGDIPGLPKTLSGIPKRAAQLHQEVKVYKKFPSPRVIGTGSGQSSNLEMSGINLYLCYDQSKADSCALSGIDNVDVATILLNNPGINSAFEAYDKGLLQEGTPTFFSLDCQFYK